MLFRLTKYLIAIGLILATLFFGLVSLIDKEKVIEKINDKIKSDFGKDIKYDHEIDLNFFPFPQIKLKNIKYSEDGDINFDWMSENIINCQKYLNKTKESFNIYKTHSVRHLKFTNETVNLGFIYIIRDPRDIVISLSHFAGGSIERTINEILYSKKLMTKANGAKELLSTWNLHTRSWLDYKNVPLCT